jgi:hypothetical protein
VELLVSATTVAVLIALSATFTLAVLTFAAVTTVAAVCELA